MLIKVHRTTRSELCSQSRQLPAHPGELRAHTTSQMERVRAEEGEAGVARSLAGFYTSESATTTHWCLVSALCVYVCVCLIWGVEGVQPRRASTHMLLLTHSKYTYETVAPPPPGAPAH